MASIKKRAAALAQKGSFVEVRGEQFFLKGKPYYYIGTNYWYGASLGSTGEGGDRERLKKELDLLKKSGVNNLRVLVGAEGPNDQPYRVSPALQEAPGKYNEALLDGFDYLLAEMKRRDLKAILFLNNSWEWSGGFMQYLNWNGYGPIPYLQYPENSWEELQAYTTQFHICEPCLQQYFDHVKFILGRTNKYTGLKYTEDPAIMSWEVANEPRPFSKESIPAFKKWIGEVAQLIKSLDPNHLLTTGSEGKMGSDDSIELFEEVHAQPNIDYLTFHIWPNNWGWLDKSNIPGSVDKAIALTNHYIDEHIPVANKLNKPIVFEEFGLPRDNMKFDIEDTTKSRDKYYANAFRQIVEHAEKGGPLAGVNFWAFGGSAKPSGADEFWKKGDPYMGDPPQEEQGLNAVFDSDTTMDLVREYTMKLKKVSKARKNIRGAKNC